MYLPYACNDLISFSKQPYKQASLCFLKFILFILRERAEKGQREREREEEIEREKGRERSPSRLCTISADPDVGLKLRNHEIMI